MGLYNMNRDTLKLVGTSLKSGYTPFYNIGGTVTEIETEVEEFIPDKFSIAQNYPNPFNPETIIKYNLPEAAAVKIKIYDALGNEIAAILNETQFAGQHEIKFDANVYRLASGVYFYRIEAGDFNATRKMIYLK